MRPKPTLRATTTTDATTRRASDGAREWVEDWAERAAIVEYDGRVERADAERLALEQMRPSMPGEVARLGTGAQADRRDSLNAELDGAPGGEATSLDPRLQPFVRALARLLVADLERRPPKRGE